MWVVDPNGSPYDGLSFDVATLRNAKHYPPDPGRLLTGCERVPRGPGMAGVGSVDKSWLDFNPRLLNNALRPTPEPLTLFTGHVLQTTLLGPSPMTQDDGAGAG